MNWQTSTIGEVAVSFVDGPFGSNLKASEYVSFGVPVARIQNVRPNEFNDHNLVFISQHKAIELNRHDFCGGDVLITKLGEPAGVACIVPAEFGSGRIVADVTRFRGNRQLIDHHYLVNYINSPVGRTEVAKRAKGSTRQRINLSDLRDIPLPLPPLDEQRQIAAILGQVDDLRRMRRGALEKLEALLQADFILSFVSVPGSNWPEVSVEDISKSIRTGPFGSDLLHSEFTENGIAVLGIDNAVHNEFRWDERRYISEAKYQELQRYRVFPRDLIITIMGTCGRAAIVPDDIPLAINTKHLCCLTLDENRCLPEFLHACFLRHPSVLHQLGVRERGAVMAGLNMALIKETKFSLPPLDLQRAFAARVVEIDKLKAHHLAHLAKLDALFASLQQRAFRGVL
jgi:type I restriction enzyme S subunit